ncbi:protein kinase superfamily protein [Actinidia rufa]|uniref:Protein kinase superfamily protein n=1 Tax=Actinidia rufa TaxID=165716 RepID=A0A7J0FKH9_9ERIC|nr:protein kinase superfamily protein [Actinidia rufa]
MGCFHSSANSNRRIQGQRNHPNVGGHQQQSTSEALRSTQSRGVNPEVVVQPPSKGVNRDVVHQSSGEIEFNVGGSGNFNVRMFEFKELEDATRRFNSGNHLGEGGCSYQATWLLHKAREGEFTAEVETLRQADHPNLIKLVGCCNQREERILVYEFMPLGSLEQHLHDLKPDRRALDWSTRMKIAAGVAKGLEYLHVTMNPPVIYRDLKSANILLGQGYHPKLSDFGLAKEVLEGYEGGQPCSEPLGTPGYFAPEYIELGLLTTKSDIFSFGVLLLEIITGRKAIDDTWPKMDQNLVSWAQSKFSDPSNFRQMADPVLEGQYLENGLRRALEIAEMCLHDEPERRPIATDLVAALDELVS